MRNLWAHFQSLWPLHANLGPKSSGGCSLSLTETTVPCRRTRIWLTIFLRDTCVDAMPERRRTKTSKGQLTLTAVYTEIMPLSGL